MILLSWSCVGYLDQFDMSSLSDEIELTPSFAAPVAYGGFSIQDILESFNDSAGLISLNEDSLILLYYKMDPITLYSDELLSIPDKIGAETYIQSDIDIPEWLVLGEGNALNFHKTERMDFAISPGDKLDSILLKSGDLELIAFSEFRHPGELTITSGSIIDQYGDSLNLTLPISTSDGSYRETTRYDLNGYRIILQGESDSAFVNIYFTLKLIKSSEPILQDQEAGVELSFQDVKYSSLYGYIATREITDLTQSIDLDFFSNIDGLPTIYFADPQFNLTIQNSVGIPLTLDIKNFSSRSAVNGNYVELEFKVDDFMPHVINAPTVEQIGQSVPTPINFNVATCNIDELISNIPDRIEFSFSASSGNLPGSEVQNFLLDTSKLVLDAEVILPMWFGTSGYTLKQNLDIDIEGIMESASFIESLTFSLTTLNEWPLGVTLQLNFMDQSDNVIGALFETETALLTPAPVNLEGEVDKLALQPTVFDVVLSKELIADLSEAKALQLVATVKTSGDGLTPVKLISSYLLNYQLSVAADLRINTSELNSK